MRDEGKSKYLVSIYKNVKEVLYKQHALIKKRITLCVKKGIVGGNTDI